MSGAEIGRIGPHHLTGCFFQLAFRDRPGPTRIRHLGQGRGLLESRNLPLAKQAGPCMVQAFLGYRVMNHRFGGVCQCWVPLVRRWLMRLDSLID